MDKIKIEEKLKRLKEKGKGSITLYGKDLEKACDIIKNKFNDEIVSEPTNLERGD